MKTDLIDALAKLNPQDSKKGKRFLLSDEEWDAVFAARARGITYSMMFPYLEKRGFKTMSSFLNVLGQVKKLRAGKTPPKK